MQNFYSFSAKIHLVCVNLANYARNRVVFRENLRSWHKFYTTAGRDGRDKFQLWALGLPPPTFVKKRPENATDTANVGKSRKVWGNIMELIVKTEKTNRMTSKWRKTKTRMCLIFICNHHNLIFEF